MKYSGPVSHVHILWLLTTAFVLRVVGQAVQHWIPQDFLPSLEYWQGSSTPYPVLLLFQLLIVALMLCISWRIGHGINLPAPRLGRPLCWFGRIYMLGSIFRIVIGLSVPSAPAWFSAWISAVFHLVLAAFVLIAAHCYLQPNRSVL